MHKFAKVTLIVSVL